jgi:hypothetical protein
MAVAFMQLRQIETCEGLGGGKGLLRRPVQHRRQLHAQLGAHFAVVVAGVIEPLLAVGQAMAPFIHGDQGVGGEIAE